VFQVCPGYRLFAEGLWVPSAMANMDSGDVKNRTLVASYGPDKPVIRMRLMHTTSEPLRVPRYTSPKLPLPISLGEISRRSDEIVHDAGSIPLLPHIFPSLRRHFWKASRMSRKSGEDSSRPSSCCRTGELGEGMAGVVSDGTRRVW